MFLKSVTLKGFKSFAETTAVDFVPGLNVVVGPNGTGKSNIVESIAWVLGSQSPTSMRSNQMADVIFSGSHSKPALGRAEVVLTLCNEDGRLPIDFPEVAISRSLFRSGESAYALNGAPSRLGDIAEILAAAGVGRHRHVIVSQGRIDAMLSAKPAERRSILEEAAGVSAFRIRKERSLRRLRAAEENLTRLSDQLREVRRQLKPLEEQAETARRHGDLAAELESLRVHVLAGEIRDLNKKRRLAASARRDLADLRAGCLRAATLLEKKIGVAERSLAESPGVEVTRSLERCGLLLSLVRNVERGLGERHHQLERESRSLLSVGMVEVLAAEAEQIRKSLDAEEREAEKLAEERSELGAAANLLDDRRDEFKKRWGKGQLFEVEDSAAAMEGRLAGLTEMLRSSQARQAGLTERFESIQGKCSAASEKKESIGLELAEAEGRITDASEARAEARGKHEAAREAESKAFRLLGEARSELKLWQSRADSLEASAERSTAGVSAVALASIEGALGSLGEMLECEEGWEDAFLAALGDAACGLVVDGTDSALAAIGALKSEGRAGVVLPLIKRSGKRAPRVGEPLLAHVRVLSPDAEGLARALIGNVSVVGGWREAADAFAVHRGVFVTRRGDLFSERGWRVSGNPDAAAEKVAAALRRAEVEVSRREQHHHRSVPEVAAAAAAAAAAENNHLEAARHAADLKEAASLVEGRLAALMPEAAEVNRRMEAASGQVEKLRRALTDLEGLLHERRKQESLERSEAESKQRELVEQGEELSALQRSLEVRRAEAGTRKGLFRKRLREIEARLEAYRPGDAAVVLADATALASMRAKLAQGESDLSAAAGRMRSLQIRLAEVTQSRLRSLDSERSERSRLLVQAEDLSRQMLDAERAETELSVRAEALVETLRARHGCDVAAASEVEPPELSEGVTAQRRIRQLQRLLQNIGPVNPLARREYENLKERHDFLSAQLQDVRSARRELNKLIKAIDSSIVEVFSDFYRQVADSFEQCFATLFPGGQGRMRLTEPDDPLGSGVEIEARPAGKHLRKLGLLSGGERSLTALALVFAMLRSQSTPFFVLDEVDAALDDVNLIRFLRLTEEFRSEIQLLLISHQKRTMEAADCLLGVSMSSSGNSRVISERPGERVDVASNPSRAAGLAL